MMYQQHIYPILKQKFDVLFWLIFIIKKLPYEYIKLGVQLRVFTLKLNKRKKKEEEKENIFKS